MYPAARAFALELVGRQRRGDAESPRAGVGVQEEKEGEGEECEAYGRAKALLQHPGRSLEESYLLEEDLGGPNPSPWVSFCFLPRDEVFLTVVLTIFLVALVAENRHTT